MFANMSGAGKKPDYPGGSQKAMRTARLSEELLVHAGERKRVPGQTKIHSDNGKSGMRASE